MSRRIIVCCIPCLLALTSITALGQQLGDPNGPRELRITASTLPDNLQSIQHKEAAMALASGDPVLMKAWSFFCTPTRYNVPGVELEAMKVFDNLYAIPSSPEQQTIVWAIATNDGIILIDAGQEGRTEAILASLRKVGLDPARVKYILLGHGHGDHYAGAAYFQQNYGTRVGTTAADWDVIYPANAPANGGDPAPRPKRDLVLKEGTPVQLGEQTVQVIEIPGHTPGSVAFIFNVRENGQTHTAGLFGGTIQDQPRIDNAGLNRYLRSINHYVDIARRMQIDVEIQNHALFDDTPRRLAMLKTRRPVEPNPFLMSNDKYVRLWNLVGECIQAELAKRPQ
jgi:metallo-beta-lactamase class B